MSTNPYSIPSAFANTPPHRRPSYANVAAGGAAGNLHPSRFNTLAAVTNPSAPSDAMALSPHEQQPLSQSASQRPRSSLRSMDIDGQNGQNVRKRPGSSWSNDAGRSDGRMGCAYHDEHPPFLTPSYLRHSRHVQRLQRAWDAHIAELQENLQLLPPPPGPPSLSTSPSNSHLSKMHASHVHRGPVQDVIERIPPVVDDYAVHPLPTRLSVDDKCQGLEILADGGEVRFTGSTKQSDEAASVRADHPMPRECGLYYFEITVLSRGKDAFIGVGFSGRKVSLNRLPGWDTDSWAYHGDDGFSFACTANGKAYGPKFATQDTVGCGVNFRTGNAFFTKNGVYLGVAFSGIKGQRLYPSVGMKKPNDHVSINFGRSAFMFDIDRMMAQERQTVMADLTTADLSGLHPPDDAHTLIHNLIGQYLAHEGYIETAKAFASDVNAERETLPSSSKKPLHLPNAEDDVHAANRQKIRRAILNGDIDKALKFTNCFYPHVLNESRNKDIHFRLRCRKFIEMMRNYTELSAAAALSSPPPSSNGHADGADGGGVDIDTTEQIDTQMELDDQLNRESAPPNHPSSTTSPSSSPSDIDMDTSQELSPSKASLMAQNELLAQALAYGQELQSTFGSDPRPQIKKQLSDIFAIMAYTNPSESVVGGLMDAKGRVQIAEDLNGAILVSLGKPSSAALEKLSAQTEALLDEAATRTGGAAAFVNVNRDFLRA